jgi:hypothetical protein
MQTITRSKPEKKIYEDLRELGVDVEGWELYYAAKELTNIDVYSYFYTEDNQGYFEEIDGNGLLKWLEIAAFAKIEWNHEQPPYEKYSSHTLDVKSPKYVAYLSELYPLALVKIKKLVEKHGDEYIAAREYLTEEDRKVATLNQINSLYGISKCDVCGVVTNTVFRASKMGCMSFEYCKKCLEKGLEPYWAMIGYISGAGHFPDDINEEYVTIVKYVLKELDITEEQFIKDVEADLTAA